MDTSMVFDEEERKKREEMSVSNWQLGLTSMTSFEADESRVEHQPQNLQVIRKKERPSVRPVIPATLYEKLAYYRAFVSSPSKTEMACIMHVRFNRFLWYYIFNVFCKSLPNTYVYIFLSSYAAEEHFFVTKMVPISCGFIWASIFSGFMALLVYTDHLALTIDYFMVGLVYKNPWNTCHQTVNIVGEYTVICRTVLEFAEMYQNVTPVFEIIGYKCPNNETKDLFQVAPIMYFASRMPTSVTSYFQSLSWVYLVFVWTTAALLYKQVYKRHIWKILHYSQMALNCMLVLTFVHLVISYMEMDFKKVPVSTTELNHILWDADIDMLAESTTSPPIVHILTARGTEEINPSRDSTILIASNALFYIFRGLLAYIMKRYCENKIGGPILLTQFSPLSSFYFWPIYFSYFYLGDFFSLTYFFLNFIMELMVVVITFHCLVEAIVWEYRWINQWFLMAFIIIAALLVDSMCISTPRLSILFIYWTGVTTFAETVILYCLFPLKRLVDDISFYQGFAPTPLRVLNLMVVPIFYAVKLYTMLSGFFQIARITGFEKNMPLYVETLYITIIPYIVGVLYAIYTFVYKKKKSWKQLFMPLPEWGPKDFNARQLRKQYDSREYIGSQASRELSRYMLEKAELKTYQLDIPHESHSRTHADVRLEDEKKIV